RHQKIDGEIVELKPLHFSDIVAPVDPQETAMAELAYMLQTWSETGNPPEAVFEQGEATPRVLDYINHAQSKRTDRPLFDQDYAQYDPPYLLSSPSNLVAMQMLAGAVGDPNLAFAHYVGAGKGTSALVYWAGERAKAVGLDMAGTLLQHHLGVSGETYEIPVNELLADVPGFRQSITEYVGFNLGKYFTPSNVEGSDLNDKVLEEVGDHTVYAFPLDWREVGIGAEDDIFGFDGDITHPGLVSLLLGLPLPEDITVEAYDWYLAMGKFYYYPRVTVVVDNNTGNAEVGLVLEVRDQYDWHADAGPLDSTMADLEEAGFGKHFSVYGRSSPIIGTFNLNDKMMKDKQEFYQLRIDGWDGDE
ncbi:MAG: hypothetical protein OXG78_16535, partial [Chloroflexi bacterium]|nr:hypothetical protein [Chloroflexota bacterium]